MVSLHKNGNKIVYKSVIKTYSKQEITRKVVIAKLSKSQQKKQIFLYVYGDDNKIRQLETNSLILETDNSTFIKQKLTIVLFPELIQSSPLCYIISSSNSF
jgi:hypothetical protein